MNELEARQILGIEDMGVRIDDRLLAIDLDDGPGWQVAAAAGRERGCAQRRGGAAEKATPSMIAR